ncbi:7-carboxy-7-deazaguanine synthase [Motiliproteus sediminis]|uniref:7-carboxy-7-deazaguanine synthase n=1 Tax=Motiliproteus sediminis TaxID=1468178 RepID=UPI001AEF82E5|nr:7-carboxy-7-deazaguanine synthase [Motiliproteus sediminis]
MYSVKETFYSLQGEGAHTGRPSIFCRFTGCNLWSGREQDRARAACRFCDTDFVGTDGAGGGKFSDADKLASHLSAFWPDNQSGRYVVFTGGEPLLQLDEALIIACHDAGFEIAIETNGTLPAPQGIDWVCVSPKESLDKLVLRQGDELKLVYPQAANQPCDFESLAFRHFYLQPKEESGQDYRQQCIDYCLQHPRWRLSLQTHKLLGID